MKNILRRVTRAAASTALVFTLLDVSAMAKAQGTWDGQRAVVVKYGRTALDTPSGRAALDKKIRRAAENVCGTPSSWTRQESIALAACRHAAIARANQDVASRQSLAATRRDPLATPKG
jgi:UrcA family protein